MRRNIASASGSVSLGAAATFLFWPVLKHGRSAVQTFDTWVDVATPAASPRIELADR
jgi:hypothetical protein